jgi:hypothetical protein
MKNVKGRLKTQETKKGRKIKPLIPRDSFYIQYSSSEFLWSEEILLPLGPAGEM